MAAGLTREFLNLRALLGLTPRDQTLPQSAKKAVHRFLCQLRSHDVG